MLPLSFRSAENRKMRSVSFTSLGASSRGNCMPFSRRNIAAPPFTPSVQVMVRLFPSTTVTAPTGSMVTVWAIETPNTSI